MTFKVLKKVIKLKSVDSTNKFIKKTPLPNGTVVIAETQTSGYGKQGATWYSGKGGLWASYLIRKKITAPYIYVIISSIAITDTMENFGLKADIKWPNDIYIKGKKIAGILIENDVFNKTLVTGIGININNEISPQVKTTATSMREILKKQVNAEKFFDALLVRLDYYLAHIKKIRPAMIRKWTSLQLDIKGKRVRIGKLKGKVAAISKTGIVTLELAKGKTKKISGEIFFI